MAGSSEKEGVIVSLPAYPTFKTSLFEQDAPDQQSRSRDG